ncbi:hypothetical protein H4219_004268 [Mycoemilia scoparia]|uniref:Uncharacterized protein n=1 Tax=Mycoemilia scoparia TaxID=417184 RepID=A0A9W8DS46_9FUNG|nr:hypothetical protein H4219_004268 [Mycoemilia scoparia]
MHALRSQWLSPNGNLAQVRDIPGINQCTSDEVFSNIELRLSRISTYGFDYDYTLAQYTEKLPETIYAMVRDLLIKHARYPSALRGLSYDPNFAIRGLHYDFHTGWLFKLDYLYNVQLETIYRGREQLRDLEELFALHHGQHISVDYVNENLYHLNDMFSVPEACLLADVTQYFIEHDISFHPRYLAEDIRRCAEVIHKGNGLDASPLHSLIMSDMNSFLNRAPKVFQHLDALKAAGKRLFLLTNSGFEFVDKGLQILFGTKDWRDLFDVAIVSARKPAWYSSNRPFRRVDTRFSNPNSRAQPWEYVNRFDDGEVYSGGNLTAFSPGKLRDAMDPTLQQGWKTGAIVHELDRELEILNTPDHRCNLAWMHQLENLLKKAQQKTRSQEFITSPAEVQSRFHSMLESWRDERKVIRAKLKDMNNAQFGSVFRTHKNPSLFAQKIRQFANLYTSGLGNFANYPLDFVFYPNRDILPHESFRSQLNSDGYINSL